MKKYNIIPLGEILGKEYEQSKIEECFKKFSCQLETDLENFLIHKAITYENTNYGKTYLFIDEDALQAGEFVVLAYFTIAFTSVDISSLSNKKKRKVLGNYPGRDGLKSITAYLIGQLGRCDECSKDGLTGEQILDECYHAISLAAKVVGGNMVILECREHMYEKFYKQKGFQTLYNELSDEGLYTLYKKIDFQEYWKS